MPLRLPNPPHSIIITKKALKKPLSVTRFPFVAYAIIAHPFPFLQFF